MYISRVTYNYHNNKEGLKNYKFIVFLFLETDLSFIIFMIVKNGIKPKGVVDMKTIITGRNVSLSEALKNHVESKLSKFDKFFRSDIEAQITLSHSKRNNKKVQVIEITIPLKNDAAIRVQEESEDMYASVDMAVDKLSKQIIKHKTKLEKRYRSHDTIRFEQIPSATQENSHEIVKMKRFSFKPMDPEEAVLQMELLGHGFFVFRNGETEEVNVVYARKDGKYGLIEPEY